MGFAQVVESDKYGILQETNTHNSGLLKVWEFGCVLLQSNLYLEAL